MEQALGEAYHIGLAQLQTCDIEMMWHSNILVAAVDCNLDNREPSRKEFDMKREQHGRATYRSPVSVFGNRSGAGTGSVA